LPCCASTALHITDSAAVVKPFHRANNKLYKNPPVYQQLSKTFLWLKGLSHEIFTVIFWLEWIYIGLNENRYWFLNF
jgi:hypothetical protein